MPFSTFPFLSNKRTSLKKNHIVILDGHLLDFVKKFFADLKTDKKLLSVTFQFNFFRKKSKSGFLFVAQDLSLADFKLVVQDCFPLTDSLSFIWESGDIYANLVNFEVYLKVPVS